MHRNRTARWTGRVLLGAEGLLLVLFCVGYAGAYVHPRHFWGVALVALGLPYLSLLLLPAFAAVVAARRWKLALAHGLCIVLALVRFLPAGVLPAFYGKASTPRDLVVMSYNVPDGALMNRDGPARQAALVEVVRAAAPHVLGLQETALYPAGPGSPEHAWTHAVSLRRALGYRADWPARYGMTSKPVVGRVPLLGQERLQLYKERNGTHTSYAVRTVFLWQGKEVVHYNVHLHSYHVTERRSEVSRVTPRSWLTRLLASRDAYLARAREAQALRALLDEETRPFLVSGDFNDTAHSWAYHHIARGLTDAFRAGGHGWGATWHARLPLFRIDFILASPEWEVVSARVPDVILSDHRPLVARLRLNDARLAHATQAPGAADGAALGNTPGNRDPF